MTIDRSKAQPTRRSGAQRRMQTRETYRPRTSAEPKPSAALSRRRFVFGVAAIFGAGLCGVAWMTGAASQADGAGGVGRTSAGEGSAPFGSGGAALGEGGRGQEPNQNQTGGQAENQPPFYQSGLSPDDWRLTLVNPEHAIDSSYAVPLATTSDGRLVDERCLADTERLLGACRAAGFAPFVCSAYRTQETQEGLFENHVRSLIQQGYSEADARVETATVVARPGTSEHQLGLALDIVDEAMPDLTEAQETTPTQRWLMEHCWEFGYILRYPTDKSAITGIVYEPWHYRYVGEAVAREIRELGICLEEYLGI